MMKTAEEIVTEINRRVEIQKHLSTNPASLYTKLENVGWLKALVWCLGEEQKIENPRGKPLKEFVSDEK